MQALESYLSELHALVESNSVYADPHVFIQDLRTFVLNEVKEDDLGLCSSLLFASEINLLHWIDRSVQNKTPSFVQAREVAFVFLDEYIKILGKKVQDYALDIKQMCVSIFRRDQSNTVKAVTFLPIMRILHLKLHFLDAGTLGVREMAELYLREYTTSKSTASATMKGRMLEMLGLFGKLFPESMYDKSSQLTTVFMDCLQRQFKAQKQQMKMISSSIVALTYFLTEFSGDFLNTPKNVAALYKCVCMALEPPPNITKYEIPKASMRFITEHGAIIKEYLTEDSEKMYVRISNWCKHPSNKKLRTVAFHALESFFAQVSAELVAGARNFTRDQATFTFFMKKFFDLLESQTSTVHEISIAIRGFGRFAAPVQQFMGAWELKRMLNSLFQFSERLYSASQDQMEDTIQHLSSFINSFANILLELKEVDDSYVDHLETIIGTLFVIFPQIHQWHRDKYYSAVSRLFVSLYSKPSALRILLSRVVFQGLTLTCSKSAGVIVDAVQGVEAPLFREYSDLWTHLLKPQISSDLDFPADQVKDLSRIIYDELITGIISMIHKLDLGYMPAKTEQDNNQTPAKDLPTNNKPPTTDGAAVPADGVQSAASTQTLQPNVPKDFDLFLNLVEFCKTILPSTGTEFFTRWVYIFGKELITRSNRFPLVSGFYKLLSIAMKICEKEDYFTSLENTTIQEDADEMVTDESENKSACYALFSKFLKEVISRTRHYKDELLAACLQLVLSVPKIFINVPRLLPCLKIAFTMGLSHLPLAHLALDALEYWIRELRDIVLPYCNEILPPLNDYLLVTPGEESTRASPTQTKAAKKLSRERHITKAVDIKSIKSPVVEVQLRILRLLGKLGGENIHLIGEVNLLAPGTESDMAWDSEQRVKLVLPFHDLKPELFLDGILPQIVDLARDANDRQTKVAACELLHAIVLYMVGTNAHQPQPTPYSNLYYHIFRALLRLATDVDLVTRQLFEPLVYQLIHWFTGNTKMESKDTMTLLDAIIDAVGNPSDSAMRDFAAKCLTEFLKWSLKQTTKQQQEKNPFNAKSLFKRLYNLSHHPDAYKRLGAALTFNELHRVFREEEALVDQFALEMMHNNIFSLRLVDEDDSSSLAIAEHVSSVIRSLTRVLLRYSEKLNKTKKNRREHPTLAHFVDWVFLSVGRQEIICRTECMELFSTLTPVLPGVKSPAAWIQQKLEKDTLKSLISVFECEQQILKVPNQKANQSLEEHHYWFKRLAASLDCYIWGIVESYIQPGVLTVTSGQSSLLKVLGVFIKQFALTPFRSQQPLTPLELEKLNKSKCGVIQRLLSMFLLCFDKCADKVMFGLCGQEFFELVAACLLTPSRVGFTLEGQQPIAIASPSTTPSAKSNTMGIYNKMPQVSHLTGNICSLLAKELQDSQLKTLHEVLRERLEGDCSIAELDLSLQAANAENLTALITGYSQLHSAGLLEPILGKTKINRLTSYLSANLFAIHSQYTPIQLVVAREILNLLFSLGFSDAELLKLLLDDTVVEKGKSALKKRTKAAEQDKDDENAESGDKKADEEEQNDYTIKKTTKGSQFYDDFLTQIDEHVIKNFKNFVKVLVTTVAKNAVVFRVLINVVDKYNKNKSSDKRNFLLQLSPYLPSLARTVTVDSATHDQRGHALELARKLLRLEPTFMLESAEASSFLLDIFTSFMGRSHSLTFKAEVLALLPYLVRLPAASAKVKERVNEMIVYDFPITSKDIVKGSKLYNDYIAALDGLLTSLELTGAVLVLESLFPVLNEASHQHAEAIVASLARYISRVSDENAKEAFDVCFKMFQTGENQDELKTMVISRVCVPLLHHMSSHQALEICTQYVPALTEILCPPVPKFIINPAEKRSSLVDKTCAFKVVEAMYKSLPANTIKDKLNKIYYPKSDAKGTELTAAIMRAAHASKSEKLTYDEKHVTSRIALEYHCSAYNCLASVVVSTQTKENFFHVFLFKESREKNELVWENIVDVERQHKFEIETNFPVANKAVESLQASADPVAANPKNKQDLRYLSGQYLADSSLSQDVSSSSFFGSYFNDKHKMDTTPSADDDVVAASGSLGGGSTPPSSPAKKTVTAGPKNVYLELDSINDNACMPVILQVLDTMQAKFSVDYLKNEMPKWMIELHTKITAKDAPHNVSLFIAKIVCNRPAIFEPYASFWFRPLMTLAILPESGSGFHYFLRDICVLLLRWKDAAPSDSLDDRQLASQFMNHLVKHCTYPVRPVIRSNWEIIKLLVEKWKGKFVINKHLILELLSRESKVEAHTKLYRLSGLHILADLLANDLPVYDKTYDSEISEFKFYEKLLENLNFHFKEIYTATAEVCGMVLLQVQKKVDSSPFEQLLKDKVNILFNQTSYDRLLNTLFKIGGRSPAFLLPYYTRLFSIFPPLRGEFKVTALNLILWNVDDIPDLFMKLKSVHLEDLLKHKHTETQLVTLQILYKMLKLLTTEQAQNILNLLIGNFDQHPDEQCRELFYDILIWIYDNNKTSEPEPLRVSLLKGLSDDSDAISTKLFEFWDHETRLSTKTFTRLNLLFSKLYSWEVEGEWLGMACRLLIGLTRRSPDFDRALFDKPLTDLPFREYAIDPSWQSKAIPLTPLFAASIPGSQDEFYDANTGGIRATQTPLFTPTQIGGTFQPVQGTQFSQNSASLYNSPKKKKQTVFEFAKPSEDVHMSTAAPAQQPKSGVDRLQRRFEKSELPQHLFFIAKNRKELKQKEAWAERHQMARANQVTMLRKYRTGDLPDIQIRSREIILPLQALAHRDPTVARNLFSSIFDALYKQVPKNSADQMKPELRLQFENVFRNTRHNTPFVGCLLRICLEHISLSPPPSYVGEAALKSSNYPTGIVLLEKLLNKMNEMDKKNAKKVQQEPPKEVSDLWSQLSKLYRALREDDIVLGLVDKHFSHHPFTKLALESELKGDFLAAHNMYIKALAQLDSGQEWDGPAPSNAEIDLWEEGKLECLAKLGKWEGLQKNTLVEFPDTDELFMEKNIDPYLSYFLVSHMKLKDTWPNLFKFVDSAEGVYKDILDEKFAPELSFVSTCRSDFDRGRFYVNKFFRNFVEDWAPIHPLATAARHKKLQLLQKVIELEEFLDFVGDEKNFKETSPMKELTNVWRDRYPSANVDDIVVWDNVTTNRALLLERISDKFSALHGAKDAKDKKIQKEKKEKSGIDLRQIKQQLLQERSELYHRMSIGARKLGNLPVADYYIKLSFEDNNLHGFSYQQMHSLVKVYTTKAKRSEDTTDSIDKFVKALKFVIKNESKVQNQEATNQQKLQVLTAGVYRDLQELAIKHGDSVLNSMKKNQFGDFPSLAALVSVSAKQIADELFNRAYKSLQQAVELGKEGVGASKAFLKFALFCDNTLKQRKESSSKASDNELLASSVVSNIMDAMRLATPGAIDRFPRLLEIIGDYPKISKEFIQKAKTVPCWMFIRWISQMLALLDKPEGPSVIGILMEIGKTYPAALFYPFKISSENLRTSAPHMVEQLQAVLKRPLLDVLVTHLGLLTHPEHRFKDWMEALKPMIKPDRNEDAIKAVFRDMVDDVLNSSNPNFGDYNREFAKKWVGDVTAHFGKDGSKLVKLDAKKFAEIVNSLASKQKPPSGMATMKLKDFSGWLADFDQSDYPSNEYIELPGQYSGYEQPLPESHIRISSFDPTLLVMSSLRKPKRLKMRGNDERDYPFLVKGGEDLRLDQRVQQLFSVMNTILQSDPACCKRKLGLKTYQVVPMTTRVGMIEWLNNTMPLKEIIEKQLVKPGHAKVEISKIEAAHDHQKWIDKFANKVKDPAHSNVSMLYHAMIHHASRDATVKKVEDQYQKIPRNLLQRGIESLAASPEAYLFIRNQFARSLATFNICSYIIGIGDRHLDNFLLNQADGRLIGIDFGHAFGTATQFLPIPELMPFRLTRQFTQFLQPLDSEGLLNHNMVHTLTAMRANKDILLNTMDVFVKEPLLDWEKFAHRLAKEQGKGKGDARQWFPNKKLEIVKLKLDGFNPATIISQEIRESTHAGKDYENSLHTIIKGDPKFNIRAKVKERCSSVKEQVECLVDMATDANILGRTWGGWAPWI